MGQLIIEVPQNINRKFSIKSVETANQILQLAKRPKAKRLQTITLDLPNLDDVDAEDALGIWPDRRATAEEIAGKVRELDNGKMRQTITLDYPYDLDEIDESEAIGIWADREESAEQIARTLREKNRKVT